MIDFMIARGEFGNKLSFKLIKLFVILLLFDFYRELYLWAYGIITSRSFPNKLIDPEYVEESKEALIPLADSLNHRPRQKVTWQFPDGKSMRMIAGETIECGKEIYNNYVQFESYFL